MSSLADLPLEQFSKLADSLVDEMTGYIPEPWQNLTSNLQWSDQELKTAKEELMKIIIEAVHYTDSQKLDALKNIYDGDKSDYIVHCISSRKLDIAKALLKQHNASVKPVLDDFDWKVKWILGNSSSTVMKYPLISVDLYTLSHENNESDSVSVELTKSELDSFIETLEEQYNKF
ncbi:COMM domain-containing protein 8-like [Arctopsyche grandis]|uniref:COMM domain-containing protein 8-like n=1 Tax=Arctopsyche grandis TaxID=121162 RepID=UPI00406D9224